MYTYILANTYIYILYFYKHIYTLAPPLGRQRRPFGKPPPLAAVKKKNKYIKIQIWGAMGAPVGASA